MYKLPLLFIFIIFPELLIGQQAGTLDLSFDLDGLVVNDPGIVGDHAYDIAQQSDGKLVIAGNSSITNDRRSLVSRFFINGTIDNTFGNNGYKILNLQIGVDDYFNSIFIQTDGKIVLSGPSGTNNPFSVNVVRLLSNGDIDSTFGINGVSYFNFGTSYFPNEIIQDTFGRTLIVGNQNNGTVILRLLTDGTLDSSFASSGILTAPPTTAGSAFGFSISLDGTNRIVIAGYAGGLADNYLIARFNSSGIIDSSFGQAGYFTHTITGFGGLNSCAIQSDGKIVAAGSFDASGIGNNHDFVITRLNPDGTADSSFSVNGFFEYPVSSSRDILQSILIQDDGKILASGYALANGAISDFAIIRLESNGSLDNSFGTNGLTLTDFNGTFFAISRRMIIQNDLKIVVCGWTFQSNISKVAMARYHSGLFVNTPDIHDQIVQISIYPNPAIDIIKINYRFLSKKSSFKVFNAHGQEIKQVVPLEYSSESGTFNIDISNVPPGIYLIQIKDDFYCTAKFIKF